MGIEVASSFTRKAAVPLDDGFIRADNTARDAIASGVRYEGMLVYVEATQTMWQLQGGITNSDWVEAGGGGADRTLSNLESPTAINQDLIPAATDTYKLGDSTNRWSEVTATSVFTENIYEPGEAIPTIDIINRRLNTSYLPVISWDTGRPNMNSNRVSDVADPVDDQDAATKIYVDTAIADGASGTANKVTLASAVQSVAVTFATAQLDTNYSPIFSFENLTDADPIFLLGRVSAKSTTGFTVYFNAPTDSANYIFNWAVIQHG